MVQEFLANCSEYYIQAGIDIYYYDSSVSDETENIVCGWPDQGHVYYIRMPSEVHANEKAYKIFQGNGLKKEYDFIWLSNDGLQCTEEAIDQLMSVVSLKYDIIEISQELYDGQLKNIFTDYDEYMQQHAWYLTLFGAALLNSHTMLNGVDWTGYEEKFLKQPTIDWSHISFYFNRILELDNFCAFHLTTGARTIRVSKLKKSRSWDQKFFYIICEGWVKTIENLPDCYTKKDQVMMDAGTMMKDIEQFYRLKERDIYSIKIFLKYRALWNKVTHIPKRKLFFAAIVPKFAISASFSLQILTGEIKLKKFCRVHPRIVIFGAGVTGEIFDEYFKKNGLLYKLFVFHIVSLIKGSTSFTQYTSLGK